MIYFFYFLTVLTKFCDYDHPEAFEVWGRSLISEKEYPTAQKKIKLALKYSKVKGWKILLKHIYSNNLRPAQIEGVSEFLASLY